MAVTTFFLYYFISVYGLLFESFFGDAVTQLITSYLIKL